MLQYIILGMVHDEPLTGYDIKKRIENGVGVFYKASYGSLYPALKKLAEGGSLTMQEQPRGGRQKKYYTITPQGQAQFAAWLHQPLDTSDVMDNQLAKIYFFDRLPADARQRQLQAFEAHNLQYLEQLQQLERYFDAMENKDSFYYKLSTLYYGICMLQTNLAWCRQVQGRQPFSALCGGGGHADD